MLRPLSPASLSSSRETGTSPHPLSIAKGRGPDAHHHHQRGRNSPRKAVLLCCQGPLISLASPRPGPPSWEDSPPLIPPLSHPLSPPAVSSCPLWILLPRRLYSEGLRGGKTWGLSIEFWGAARFTIQNTGCVQN